MLMECDDPLEVHKFCSMLPAFTFEARPAVPVAIRVELEAMSYRDGLKSKYSAAGPDIRTNALTILLIVAASRILLFQHLNLRHPWDVALSVKAFSDR